MGMGVVDRYKSGASSSASSESKGVISRYKTVQKEKATQARGRQEMRYQETKDYYEAPVSYTPPPEPEPEKPSTWDRIKSVGSTIDNGVSSFLDSAANTATFGLHNKLLKHNDQETRIENQESIPGKVGEFAGMLVPIEGAYATGGKLASTVMGKFAPNAPKLLQSGVRGIGAGLTYGAAKEGLDAAIDTRMDGDQTIGQRLKTVGMDAALFGAGDAALAGAGQMITRAGQSVARNLTGSLPKAALETGMKREVQQAAPSYEGLSIFKNIKPPVDETAAAAEPMKQNWFTNLFGSQGVGVSAVSSAKKISKGPLTTADQIVQNPLKRDIVGLKENAKAAGRATYQNYVDQLAPLQKISRETYEKSIDAARSNNIANTIVRDKFVNPEGVVIGEGLANTFQKVARGQSKDFLDYIVLRHAVTREGRGEQVYAKNLEMTPETIQSRLDMYDSRHPEFKNIAAEWDKYNENMLKTYGVNEGLMSEEMFNTLRQKNPNYAPMRRQFSTSEKFASPLSMGAKPTFSGQKAPIKEVSPTGSVRNIVDPRRSAIEATGAWVNAAMRNRVMQSIVQKISANADGMKGIAEIVQKPKGQKELREVLEVEGHEGLLEMLDDDFNKLFKRTKLDQDNIVRAMIKGEPVYIKVNDPEAVKALIGMGSEQSNLVMDVFDKFSRATKFGATGALAPMFAVKGLTTDIAQSLIQSKNPVAHLYDLGHAIVSSIADTLPKNTPGVDAIRALSQEFRRAGGEYSAALRGDRPLKRSVREMDRNPILSPKGVLTGAGKTVAAPFKALYKVSDIAENVNRMAAYKGELRRLGGERTPENITQAMSAGREITTNFSRKGSQSQNIEKFVPYSNAAVQGINRFIRAFKQHPIKTTALVGGTVMAPKFMEYMRFHDDPDYQQLPAREKYRNIMVNKNADGTFSKIPMPPEYNALGAFMVDALEYFKDNDPNAFKGAKDAIANAYTPPQVSGLAQPLTQGGGAETALTGGLGATVLAPAVSVVSNKDFAGRPIESMALSDRSPKYRYDERTSSPAKWLGDKLNMSPKKVDYLIRSYGGDPARILLPLTSKVGQGDVKNTLLKNFIVDPTFTSNLTNDFYAAKEMINQAYRDNKEVEVPLPEWYDEELRKLISSTAKGSMSDRLSELSDQKKTVTTDKLLSSEQRTQKLKDIQQKMNEIYLDINSKVAEKEIPIPRR